ncbi:MAG TPA: DUF5666 domain-containing protein, partial [Rubrivivax sp.]|nr:DUF5666 domain-containing protein [Rubrivivax sp.]
MKRDDRRRPRVWLPRPGLCRYARGGILAALAGMAILLAACGGGVGSGGTGGFASGPITGFGSVIVNGVRFDDTAATVVDGEGSPRTRDDLRLGMTVEVESGAITVTQGAQAASARRIEFDCALRGPVTALDKAGGAFTLLGQRVVVDATTVFDDRLAGGLNGLAAGRMLEVYAVFDPAGLRYRATRVEA